jgi:hypothetical protein
MESEKRIGAAPSDISKSVSEIDNDPKLKSKP